MNSRTSPTSLARRGVLGLLSTLGAAALGPGQAAAAPVAPGKTGLMLRGQAIQVVDLTHQLTADFNISPPRTRLAMQPIDGSGVAVGMKLNLLSLVEHTGTHIDAPRHFSDTAPSLGEMPIGDLVTPLAVLDLRDRARQDRNLTVTVDDILQWERRHGRLPEGCCVALHAGWRPLVERGRATSLPPEERRKGPGFGPEAAEMLITSRRVKGIAVEAMSIDTGTNGPAYPVHQTWLRSGRWGIEALTNLDQVPQSGAILIVGAAPIKDATGIPIRAMAMF